MTERVEAGSARTQRRPLTVEINYPACQSHGRCAVAAPDVFEMAEGFGKAYPEVLVQQPQAEQIGRVRRAVQLCPTKAVLLTDY